MTDDGSEYCAFQQERTLVAATATTLKKLSQITPHIKVVVCPMYMDSIIYFNTVLRHDNQTQIH